MPITSTILSTGSYIPQKKLTNDDLAKMVDTSDEWIKTRTGIETRFIADNGESCSYMGIMASKRALEKAHLTAFDIDLIIVATITPDMQMPSTACLIQKELGAKNAFAYDLNAACSGFLFALSAANDYLKNNPNKKALVIGSEVLSKKVNWQDRATCVLFGDGAGAVVMTSSNCESGIREICLHSDGTLWELLTIKGCGSLYPCSSDTLNSPLHYIQMEGKEVFKHAVRSLEAVSREVLERTGWSVDDVDILISHQANVRILHAVAEKLDLPAEKVFININKYGNTSSASIPLALDEANTTGILQKGMKVLLTAFGGGFTWGAITLIW